jgi:hypothetical protein
MIAVVSAIVGLIGVLLGGGVRAWEASRSRKLDADSLLSALCAEVEALTRLINHRRFVEFLTGIMQQAQAQVAEGRGEEVATFAVISLKHDYFTVYKETAAKIGLLHPYHADRIVRFYEYVKAVQENYDPSSPFQQGLTANSVVHVIESDLELLRTVVLLGTHIGTFRNPQPPKGTVDPFNDADPQPALPN